MMKITLMALTLGLSVSAQAADPASALAPVDER